MTDTPPGVDPGRPNTARMYDYYLGGKDNYQADRDAAEMVLRAAPELRGAARQGRALIERIVHHLVAEHGIKQIIDIGSGLPTGNNTHEIAHRVDPEVKVVYVDNDPVVCAHGRALLGSAPGVRAHQGDLRRPADILDAPEVLGLIDLDRPVAVLAMFVLHLVPDADGPHDAVAVLRERLAPGSFLAISHASRDARPELTDRISAIYERSNSPFVPRSRAEVTAFFGDFEPLPPGVVNLWPFPEPPADVDPALAVIGYSGVARKPDLAAPAG